MATFTIISLIFFVFAPRLSVAGTPQCKASYGTGIDVYHCKEALEHWRLRFTSAPQKFSRHPIVGGATGTMPQGAIFQTCSIGIDLVDAPFAGSQFRHVVSTWAKLKSDIDQLLYSCVSPRPGTRPQGAVEHPQWHLGGRLESGSFEYVIVNPDFRIGIGTCLQPRKPLTMSLGKCVETQANFMQHQQANELQRVQAIAQRPPARPIVPGVHIRNWQIPPPGFSPPPASPGGHPPLGAYMAHGAHSFAPTTFIPYQPPGQAVHPNPIQGGSHPPAAFRPYRPPVPGVHPIPGALISAPHRPRVPGVNPNPGANAVLPTASAPNQPPLPVSTPAARQFDPLKGHNRRRPRGGRGRK